MSRTTSAGHGTWRRSWAVLAVGLTALVAGAGGCSILGGAATPSSGSASPTVQASASVAARTADPGIAVVVITPHPVSADPFLATVVTGIEEAAAALGGTSTVLQSADPGDVAAYLDQALAARPSIIVGVAQDDLALFDPTAAANLDQQFLLVDVQPPEPTENLTTALFDAANCPAGAACAVPTDIFDPSLLSVTPAAGVSAAMLDALDGVLAGRTGGITLYELAGRPGQAEDGQA